MAREVCRREGLALTVLWKGCPILVQEGHGQRDILHRRAITVISCASA
jgi:hypothetical protein